MLIHFTWQPESQAPGRRLAAKREMARRDIQESVIRRTRGSLHPAYPLFCHAGDVSDRLFAFVKLLALYPTVLLR